MIREDDKKTNLNSPPEKKSHQSLRILAKIIAEKFLKEQHENLHRSVYSYFSKDKREITNKTR